MIWIILKFALKHLIGMPSMKNLIFDDGLMNFERNVGKDDQMIRGIIGITALICLIFVKKGFIVRYLLGLAALAGLVTAYTRFSPVYTIIGENTKKKKKSL